jgi:hypothetical protein
LNPEKRTHCGIPAHDDSTALSQAWEMCTPCNGSARLAFPTAKHKMWLAAVFPASQKERAAADSLTSRSEAF